MAGSGDFIYYWTTLTEGLSNRDKDSAWFTDVINSRFAVSGEDGSILIANDPLDIKTIPVAFGSIYEQHYYVPVELDTAAMHPATAIRFSADGNEIWVGMGGRLYRISKVLTLRGGKDVENLKISLVHDFEGRYITDIATSRKTSSHVVVTLGNYGNADYVYESQNATDATPLFISIQSDLPAMPVYSVLINLNDSTGAEIIIGTEYGVYSTDDAGASWNTDGDIIPQVPVTDLFQQYWKFSYTYGNLVAGTYGRGVYTSQDVVGVEEKVTVETSESSLSIYPNPVTDVANVSITVGESEKGVRLNVYSLSGTSIYTDVVTLIKGTNNFDLSVAGLSAGTYIVSATTSKEVLAAKMVVIN